MSNLVILAYIKYLHIIDVLASDHNNCKTPHRKDFIRFFIIVQFNMQQCYLQKHTIGKHINRTHMAVHDEVNITLEFLISVSIRLYFRFIFC